MSTDEIHGNKPAKRKRYPRKSRVFHGIDLRTTKGCRIRSLYASFVEHTELDGDNLIHQSAVLKVAKLQVIVERLQNESLKSKNHNQQLGEELVRHENMLRRAKLELNALTPEPVKWWEKDDGDGEEEAAAA